MRPGFRVTLALCQRQLATRLASKLGWFLAYLVAITFVLLGAIVSDLLDLSGLIGDALRWMWWLGAGPVALAAAAGPVERDRREGISAMCAVAGVGERELRVGRALAAMLGCAVRMAVPALTMCLLFASFAPSWSLARQALGAVAVALIAGSALGLFASVCGQFAAARGRLLLVAVVFIPWIVSDAWSLPNLSLPGVVDISISVITVVG
jgi:hypothetical protein